MKFKIGDIVYIKPHMRWITRWCYDGKWEVLDILDSGCLEVQHLKNREIHIFAESYFIDCVSNAKTDFNIGDILYLRSGLPNYVIYPALGPWKITKVLIDEYEVTLGTTGMLYRYPKNIFVQSNEVNNYSHSHFSNCIINADSIANCEFHNCTINSVTQDIKTACINLIASQKDIREVILAFSKARGSIFSRTCKNDNCVNPDHIMFYCMDE